MERKYHHGLGSYPGQGCDENYQRRGEFIRASTLVVGLKREWDRDGVFKRSRPWGAK